MLLKEKKKKGFSLIELGVATVIITSLLLIILLSTPLIQIAQCVNSSLNLKNLSSSISEAIEADDGNEAIKGIARTSRQDAFKECLVPAPFAPTDIANSTILWIDASDTSSITGSPNVSQWNDKSGSNNHLATKKGSPITGSATINSLNAIDFDGDDSLFNAAVANFDGGTSKTLFYIYQKDSIHAHTAIQIGTSSVARGWINGGGSVSGQSFYSILFGAEQDFHSANSNSPLMIRATISNPSAATVNFYINDLPANNSGNSSNPPVLILDSQIHVGGRITDHNYLTGSVGEMILYEGLLSSEDEEAVKNYLNAKWLP